MPAPAPYGTPAEQPRHPAFHKHRKRSEPQIARPAAAQARLLAATPETERGAVPELLGLCYQLNAENLTLRAELDKLSRRVEALDATTPVDDPDEEFWIEARLDSLERRVTAIANLLASLLPDQP